MTEDKGIFIKNVYYMLAYAFKNLKQDDVEKIKGVTFDNIHNLFAEILTKGVSYLVRSGLHKEYTPKSETLTTIRGKINLNSTFKNFGQRKMLVECEYDDFSENNLFNQIIKATIFLLLKQDDVSIDQKKKLKSLMMFFSEVEAIQASSIRWESLHFDRNTRTYQLVLNLCHLLIDGMLMSTDKGDKLLPNFTEDCMNRLYEKFILEFFRKHYPKLQPEASKIDWNTEDDCISLLPEMRTDITLIGKVRTLIIDAKYYSHTTQEHFDKETVHSHNVYQVHTYVMNKDRDHTGNVDGMLLYAKVEGSSELGVHQKLRDGNILFFRTLDLNQEFEGIKNQLDSIARTIDCGEERFN